MKYVFFLYLLNLNFVISQNQKFEVIKEDFDNYVCNTYINTNKFILISKNSIDIIDVKSNIVERIIIPFANDINWRPLFYYASNDKESIIYYSHHNIDSDSSLVIHSFKYNSLNLSVISLDSLKLNGKYNEYSFTNVVPATKNFIIGLNKINWDFDIDTARIIKLERDGKINILKLVSKDTTSPFFYSYGSEVMKQINKLNSNQFAIGYWISYDYTTFVDSNFNKINETDFVMNRNSHVLKDRKYVDFPLISNDKDSFIYISGFYTYRTWSCLDHAIMKAKLKENEPQIASFKLISVPEQYCKESHFISSVYNEAYFVCSLPSGAVQSDIRSIKNEFYVSFMRDTNEIWHKSFGGEYAFIVTGLNSIDSCNVLVTGAIYDYFNNGYIQQFYMVIDCQGNIVNSNIDLKEVEPSLVYPNPTKGIINLSTDLDVNRLELYDLQGSLLSSSKGQFLKIMDVSSLPTGTYLLKIFYNGKYKTERIMIIAD